MYKFIIEENAPRTETNPHWKYCIGSGQAKLALRTDYAKQLKFIHDELGIERVRFHGIFDDSMDVVKGMDQMMPIPGSENFFNYNFKNIAVAYDNVLEAGMKPWVELSFMPGRLAKEPRKVMVNAEAMSSMPLEDKEWTALIQAFIRFLEKRYGAEEIRTWNFEVWNEPNVIVFFSGTMEDYFHLYQITVKAIKEIDPLLKVGGPATATGGWIREFIDFVEKNQIPCDFISTHNYPGDVISDAFSATDEYDPETAVIPQIPEGAAGRILDGMRYIMPDKTEGVKELPKGQMYCHAKSVKEIVGDKYPIYYTEWNCNAILTSPTNDTRKAACFQIKSISEMEAYVDGSSIWCFSDIFDEATLFADPFCGGFGLLTVDGIPKPQFYALKLMAGAGLRKYVLPYTNDEVEIAIYESDEEKRVFVYRQRMKNAEAAPKEYCVELALGELASEEVKTSIFRIDEEHCNPLKVWKEMGSPMDLSPIQVKEIIEKSALEEENIESEMHEGKVILSGKLGVNDIHCYVIRKNLQLKVNP